MKLKLKENPREWQKFVAVMALLVFLIGFSLYRKRVIGQDGLIRLGVVLLFPLVMSWIKPSLFRGFYRTGMTASFHVGQVMGKVMLSLLFIGVVTPLGWALRLCGKDLLQQRKDPKLTTYWKPAKPSRSYEQQF